MKGSKVRQIRRKTKELKDLETSSLEEAELAMDGDIKTSFILL